MKGILPTEIAWWVLLIAGLAVLMLLILIMQPALIEAIKNSTIWLSRLFG